MGSDEGWDKLENIWLLYEEGWHSAPEDWCHVGTPAQHCQMCGFFFVRSLDYQYWPRANGLAKQKQP